MSKKTKSKDMKVIKLDDMTRDNLRALLDRKKEIETQMQLILGTYLNAVGATGEYQLSLDCSRLVRAGKGGE